MQYTTTLYVAATFVDHIGLPLEDLSFINARHYTNVSRRLNKIVMILFIAKKLNNLEGLQVTEFGIFADAEMRISNIFLSLILQHFSFHLISFW